jgi:hypothetical protein
MSDPLHTVVADVRARFVMSLAVVVNAAAFVASSPYHVTPAGVSFIVLGTFTVNVAELIVAPCGTVTFGNRTPR